ncbi:unnamed protein product, partial [Mesorhabditis belari]|uniref:4-coumarate--CoA ligase n=1 Tax=Mesorhabditis belari TaxID=2138241 RepID=A0AAF3ET14_9BILA
MIYVNRKKKLGESGNEEEIGEKRGGEKEVGDLKEKEGPTRFALVVYLKFYVALTIFVSKSIVCRCCCPPLIAVPGLVFLFQRIGSETWAALCGNSVDFVVFSLSANRLGLTLCPLNPALKYYEIEKYVRQAGCTRVVTEARFCEKALPILQRIFQETEIFTLEQLGSMGDENVEELTLNGEDLSDFAAFVFFSSGTSGAPKAVELTNRSLHGLIAQIKSISSSSHQFPLISPDDIIHGVLPLFHAGGMLTLYTMLLQGATVVMNDRFEPQLFLATIQEYKVSVLNIVPPILSLLTSCPLVDKFDLSTLRMIYVGAARVEPKLIETVKTRLDQRALEVVQLYGMTEAGLLIFMTPKNNERIESVGLPLPGIEFKILDDSGEASNEIPGNLWLRTPCLLKSYRGIDLKPINADGWFDSGDLARIDSDGFVYIVGRTKEMIKVKGWQVSPYELEEAIKLNVKGVEDCAVIGIECVERVQKESESSSISGVRPFAFVVGESCDTNEVLRFVAENFVSYKHLAGVSLIEALPRTASGKLTRHQLEEIHKITTI